MGTRSITVFIENRSKRNESKNGKITFTREYAVVTGVYRQMDSYPAIHGVDIADILSDARIHTSEKENIGKDQVLSNGMGDLAGFVIAGLWEKYPTYNVYIESFNEIKPTRTIEKMIEQVQEGWLVRYLWVIYPEETEEVEHLTPRIKCIALDCGEERFDVRITEMHKAISDLGELGEY